LVLAVRFWCYGGDLWSCGDLVFSFVCFWRWWGVEVVMAVFGFGVAGVWFRWWLLDMCCCKILIKYIIFLKIRGGHVLLQKHKKGVQ
jgi:hypothetical protein